MIRIKSAITAALLGAAPAAAAADNGTKAAALRAGIIDSALRVELERTRVIQDKGYPPPYFASLTMSDVSQEVFRCSMGGVRVDSRQFQRIATPDVRVGSYEMDNHPVGPPTAFYGRSLSMESDEFAIRHALWRLMDGSYKGASADFLRKQALRVNRGKAEYDTDDLSREAPRRRPAVQPGPFWEAGALRALCARAGAAFRRAPGLLHAEVSISRQREWNLYRDLEGSKVDYGDEYAEVEIEAIDITTDGMKVAGAWRTLAAAPESLPSAELLEARARELMDDLAELKAASSTSPFNAPAILDPSVSAAVVLAIGLRLSGEEQRNPGGAQIFKDKLGKLVLPAELSLVDDPTLSRWEKTPLAGHYDYDDQGVPAQKVPLIENGILKGFLLSRHPVIGFSKSNGHGRRTPGYMAAGAPGTLILSSTKTASESELIALLRKECDRRDKPYGLYVRKLRSFSQQQSGGRQDSIRLMPGLIHLVSAKTGEMTLVRDLDVVGTPLVLLNNIVRLGDKPEVANAAAEEPVSVIVPSLLVSEVELQRATTKPEKSPLLPPPSP